MRKLIILLLAVCLSITAKAQTIEVHCPSTLTPYMTLQHFKARDKASVFAFADIPLNRGDVYSEVALDVNIVRLGSFTLSAHTEINLLLSQSYDVAALAGICLAHPYFSIMAMFRNQFDKSTYQVTATWNTDYERMVHFSGYIDVWDKFANAQPQLWIRAYKGLFIGAEVDMWYTFKEQFTATPTIGVKYDF
jgi:hypothetical protein